MTVVAIHSENLEETHEIGRQIGRRLTEGRIVALVGPLGAGKTTLVKGIADGAGVADLRQVNSPTFVIVNEYEARAGLWLYHIDAYRLRGGDDLDALGFDEMAAQGAVLIEWAERVADLLPADVLTVRIEPISESQRRFHLEAGGALAESLLKALAEDGLGSSPRLPEKG